MRRASVAAIVLGLLLVPSSRGVRAQAGAAWRSPEHFVEIGRIPSGWKVESTEHSLHLTKVFGRDGLRFEEHMTVQISRDNYGSLENAVSDLRSEGFMLVSRERLAIDALGVPFWFLRRPGGEEESAWTALLLRAGRVYVIDLQSSPLDPDALSDYGMLIQSFRLLPDPREEGWRALAAEDGRSAERHFRALLDQADGDVNARYGLGLAYLAQGRADNAVRELERVGPALGLDEDVRRPLGRAEIARGRTARGIALLVQVLRDDPSWEDEVRPWILDALRHMPASSATTGSPMSAIAIECLSRFRQDDGVTLQTLRADFRREFDMAINACLSNRCDASALVQLLAAVDLEQGITLGLAALQGTDESIVAAQARVAAGFKLETLLTRRSP